MDTDWQSIQVGKTKLILILILIIIIAVIAVIASSMVNVGGDEVGIVKKHLGGGSLPDGRVIAITGENGFQAQTLAPGLHFYYWPWQYDISKIRMIDIKEGYIGLLQAKDGKTLPKETIYAKEWENPDEMIRAEYFLASGKGYKGPQLSVLRPGRYRLNTQLFTVTQVPITNVRVGTVAVIKSNVGPAIVSKNRLVEVGQRGIWNKPLTEGQYRLHTKAYEVTMISIRQVKVSYTAQKERGESMTQPLRPIMVRSKDGFTFPVDVRVNYRIDAENAPSVVARIGDDELVLTKLVTPTVRAIFRNNAGKVKALEYVQKRPDQEKQSAQMLKDELEKYGITILAVRIGDIGDEKSLGSLLKTQTDREIALQEQTTFVVQQQAAEKQKALSKTVQEAEEEKTLATARYAVQVAEQQKQQRIIDAQGEAERIKLVAGAKAKAYQLISDVLGSSNAALIEIMKLVAADKIKITPEVMIGGGSSAGMSDALMGTILRGMLEKEGQIKKTKK